MAKPRKSLPLKTRAILQKEIFSHCPFCKNDDVGHFVVHHIDEDPENNALDNLLMLCPNCHSKVSKKDISHTEVLGVKTTLIRMNCSNVTSIPSINIGDNPKISNSVVGNNNKVSFRINTHQKNKYPPGCIGSDIQKANYISYLITRYHEFKEWEVGKESMRYALFPSQLKKKYKIGKQRTIYNLPLEKFDSLSSHIQERIYNTALAKIKKSKQQFKYFQTYEEYSAIMQ